MKYFLLLILVLLIGALIFLGYWLFKKQKHKLYEFINTPEYTIDEIEIHNTADSLWTHYEGNVYDLTKFISQHPGGSVILKAGGKNLKTIWETENVEWHNTNKHILNTLDKYMIGTLKLI
jgi:cytochrome b involved in lipid metabolism